MDVGLLLFLASKTKVFGFQTSNDCIPHLKRVMEIRLEEIFRFDCEKDRQVDLISFLIILVRNLMIGLPEYESCHLKRMEMRIVLSDPA